jgi:hypothetical protein
MSVRTIPYGNDKKILLSITFASHGDINDVHCELNRYGKYSHASYNKDFYPSVCGSFENFKTIMEKLNTGKVSETHKSTCNEHSITICHDVDGTKFPPFTLKFQPYVQRTDAIILAEVHAYMKSIDGDLEKLFVSHANHISFFGFDLMEKNENAFTVKKAIEKIEEICGSEAINTSGGGATHQELDGDKSPVVSFIDRLNMINGLHKKFVVKVQADCKDFEGEFVETIKVDIAKNDKLHDSRSLQCYVNNWIASFFEQNDNCFTSYPTYVFKLGEIVEVNVEKGCDNDMTDEVEEMIIKLAKKIADKIMVDEEYGYPKYVIDMGKYQEMIFGKPAFVMYGNDEYTNIDMKFSMVIPSISFQSVASAFPHPSGRGVAEQSTHNYAGVLIDVNAELNEVQQYIISILDEVMATKGK